MLSLSHCAHFLCVGLVTSRHCRDFDSTFPGRSLSTGVLYDFVHTVPWWFHWALDVVATSTSQQRRVPSRMALNATLPCPALSWCGLYRASSLLRRLVSIHPTRFGEAEGASYTWIYLVVQMIRYASVDIKWGRTRLNPRWFALRGAVNPNQEHAGTGDLGWKSLAEIYIFFPNDCRLNFFHF